MPPRNKKDGMAVREYHGLRRKCQRWLHAGVVEDRQENIIQIWFGFVHKLHPYDAFEAAGIDEKGWYIVWAGDSRGSVTGNYGEGYGQRFLITFDPLLEDHWRQHLAPDGGWKEGEATIGKELQRTYLLGIWKDPEYHCPFPNGNPYLTIGPPLNQIRPVNPPRQILDETYPHSRILFRSDYIKWNFYTKKNPSALTVIKDFFNGSMSGSDIEPGDLSAYDAYHLKIIESAFLNCGWRVDSKAVKKTNRHIRENRVPGNLVKNSTSWLKHPPIREGMLRKDHDKVSDLVNDRGELDAGYVSSDDDDDYAPGRGPGGRPPNDGPDGGHSDDDNENDSSGNKENNDAPAPGLSRSNSSQRNRVSRGRKAKAASGKGAKESGAKKSPRKSKKGAKGKGKGKARPKKAPEKVVVDLSSDGEESEDDHILNENDDDDGYAVVLEDSDGDDENEGESGADVESRLISALRADQREDEELFVSDDDLVLVEVRSVPAIGSRLGGSGVNDLREAYLANTRVKQERTPAAREPPDQSERERRTPSAIIKTSNSTPRDGSPTASAKDKRGPSEGSSSGFLEAIHAIGNMLINDSSSPSVSPEPQAQEQPDLQPQVESLPQLEPESNSQSRLHRAASAEPPTSQRNVTQREFNSEPRNLDNGIGSVSSHLSLRPLSPIPGRRQPSGMDSPAARKRMSEDIEDAEESPAKKTKVEPEFIWVKDESESQNNPIVISDDEEDEDDYINMDDDGVVIIGDGSEDDPIIFD